MKNVYGRGKPANRKDGEIRKFLGEKEKGEGFHREPDGTGSLGTTNPQEKGEPRTSPPEMLRCGLPQRKICPCKINKKD